MSNPTPEEVRASIVPKSDQLNADDLLTGPITVTIEKVRKGDRDQPIHIDLVGYTGKSYRPCKTMRRVMIATWGDDGKAWVGQQMTLYCDPEVMWGGVKVGGIRISHLSGLSEARTFMLTKTRGKRAEVTIHPIATLSADDRQFIATATLELAEARTAKELRGYGEILRGKKPAIQDALRPIYAERQEQLKDTDTQQTKPTEGVSNE